MEELCLRIKLIFRGGILSDSQKSEGFKKTWFLLKPQHHRTISDICSHILQLFHLHESCPDGLLLYMDEFVLPPFESTSILKNKDVISVKRKLVTSTIECNDVLVNAGPLLLANEEFNKETGGYESDEPEDDGKKQVHDTSPLKDKSKKRKASEKLHSSKKKKKRSEVEEPDIDVQVEHAKKLQLVVTGKKSNHKQQKISDSKEKDNVKMSEDNVTTPVTNKNDKFQETEKDNVDATPKLDETPKRRSRSARRKSAKRQWLREMAKIQKTSTDSQSEALRNWKEMQSKSGREEAADQPNGHKTNADSRSEALRNWKEMQSKAGREAAAGQPNGHRSWKEMQSKAGREETARQPNGHQNWKWGQASVSIEEGVNQSNGCGQARVKSGHGISPQKGRKNWKQGQARVKSGEGVSLGHGQSTSERREASDQLRGLLNWNELLANDMVKDAEKHTQLDTNNNSCDNPNRMVKDAEKHTQSDTNNNSCDNPNQNGDSEDEAEVVPVEIRPGHIRFEPLGKERTVEQNQLNMENFRCYGITSKKKGQKWGTEKFSFTPRNELNGSNGEQSGMLNDEKTTQSNEPFDFTKTPFLSSFPKEGDVIAYRLLELSSTWTPELSPYQVGEVSSYDSQSGRVSLMPVPEFPIFSKKSDGDESLMQPNGSLYKEDGSLEIDFSSLVEVRILEHKTRVPGSSSECVVGNSLTVLTGTNDMQTTASISENTDLNHGDEQRQNSSSKENGVNLWEQFSETLNAKKEQLSRESNWGKGSSGKSWSYKALRGSALGPTMAFLRSKNQL